MTTQIITSVFVAGIVGLFALDRDTGARTSKALWIPVAWLLINCSRPVSMWLGVLGFGGAFSAIDPSQVYLDGSPVDRDVFTFLLVFGLIVLARRGQRLSPLFRTIRPILLFFSYCAFSVLWSAYSFVAFKHWTKGIGDVVMVLLVLTDSEPAAALRRLIRRASFLLIPLSVLFIRYYPNLGRTYSIGGSVEYTGVTPQKNALGIICLVFGLGSLWRFLAACRDRKVPRRTHLLMAHGVILAMVLWLLHTSDSMTAFSCFLMGGVVMVLANRPMLSRKPSIVHFLVAATVCFSLFALFFDPGGGLVKDLGRNPTLTGRTAIWKAIIPLAGNPLIGTGYESFWLGERLQEIWSVNGGAFKGIQEAHNGYLEIYLNLGWIGVALLAALILTGYRRIFATFRRAPVAGSLGLAYFVAQVTYNFTEAGFRMMDPLWILFLLSVIGVPNAAVSESPADLDVGPTIPFGASKPRSAYALEARFRKVAS